MVRKTKEEALATRDLILDTAECVFQRRGVSATSLQEIAQAAGLTRGAIYWHFQNKADVFDAMLQRVVLPLERALDADGVSGDADPLESLRDCMQDVLSQVVHDQRVQRVLEIAMHKVEYVGDLQVVRERRVTSREACLDDLERMLTRAVAQGRIGICPPPRVAAVGLHALMDGLLYNWLLDPQAFDLQATGRLLLETFLRGLIGPGGTATDAPVVAAEPAMAH